MDRVSLPAKKKKPRTIPGLGDMGSSSQAATAKPSMGLLLGNDDDDEDRPLSIQRSRVAPASLQAAKPSASTPVVNPLEEALKE